MVFQRARFRCAEGNDRDSDLSDESSDGDQEIERSNNWEESEGESEGREAEPAEQEDVNGEDERSSQDVLDSEDGLDSEGISDNGQVLEQFRGMLDTGEGLATNPALQSFEASENVNAITALNEIRGEHLSAGAGGGQYTEVIADDS